LKFYDSTFPKWNDRSYQERYHDAMEMPNCEQSKKVRAWVTGLGPEGQKALLLCGGGRVIKTGVREMDPRKMKGKELDSLLKTLGLSISGIDFREKYAGPWISLQKSQKRNGAAFDYCIEVGLNRNDRRRRPIPLHRLKEGLRKKRGSGTAAGRTTAERLAALEFARTTAIKHDSTGTSLFVQGSRKSVVDSDVDEKDCVIRIRWSSAP
jgi:hypothetical protein